MTIQIVDQTQGMQGVFQGPRPQVGSLDGGVPKNYLDGKRSTLPLPKIVITVFRKASTEGNSTDLGRQRMAPSLRLKVPESINLRDRDSKNPQVRNYRVQVEGNLYQDQNHRMIIKDALVRC